MRGDIIVLDAGDVLSAAKAFEGTVERLEWPQDVEEAEKAARLLRAAAYRANTTAQKLEAKIAKAKREGVKTIEAAFVCER